MPLETPLSSARAREGGPFERASRRVSERATPLLVKEVRQALRGKWFKTTLLVALGFATLAALVVLGLVIPSIGAEVQPYQGTILFGACFGAVAFATAGLVPFSAFSSMNAEAEENTLELLLISNLSPHAIVWGKIASAVVQSVILCSAAMPFAVVAWNLGGLPPSVLVLAPLFTILGTACFSAIGIALSCVSRTRWVRVLLMVLFGFFLFNVAQNVLVFAFFGAAVAFLPGGGGVPLVELSLAGSIFSVVFLALGAAFGSDLLSHREESGSTPMRATVSVIAVLGALAVFACGVVSAPRGTLGSSSASGVVFGALHGGGGFDLGAGVFLGVLVAIVVPLAWCCTEGERLPLGPSVRPPRRGVASVVRVLLLAGGGRGVLLTALLLGLLGFAHVAGQVIGRGGWSDSALIGVGLVLYAWILLTLPSVVFAPFTARPLMRVVARGAVWLFPWVGLIGTTLVFVVLRGPSGEAWENPANPVWMFREIDASGRPTGILEWTLLVVAAFVALAANAWRMAKGLIEVRRAMRERDRREGSALHAATQP